MSRLEPLHQVVPKAARTGVLAESSTVSGRPQLEWVARSVVIPSYASSNEAVPRRRLSSLPAEWRRQCPCHAEHKADHPWRPMPHIMPPCDVRVDAHLVDEIRPLRDRHFGKSFEGVLGRAISQFSAIVLSSAATGWLFSKNLTDSTAAKLPNI